MKGILDGDIIIYQLSGSNEQKIDWGDSITSIIPDLKAAQQGFIEYMNMLYDSLDIDDMVIAISDDRNWRKELNPEYKSNRKDVIRPILIEKIREWVRENYTTLTYPRLEADDVLGIEGTKDPENTIVVSDDKDMLTLPCNVYIPRKKEHHIITPKQAWYNTCYQALKGDTTDGYSGAVGIGHKKAVEALDVSEDYWETTINLFFKVELEAFYKEHFSEIYDLTELTTYKKNKLYKLFKTEYNLTVIKSEELYKQAYDKALLNLRMANILWEDQYNLKTTKVSLMTEKMIKDRQSRY